MIAKAWSALLFLIVFFTTLLLLPLHLLALAFFRKTLGGKIPLLWHKIVCRLIGIRTIVFGKIAQRRPLLLVANHVSWSDILVLGSIGELSFIAKQEVNEIAGAKWLARLQRSVFVVREKRHHSGRQAQQITRRLLDGDVIVLFSEGTTGSGNRLLPFNSSLLGSAQYALEEGDMEHVYIQPVSICYTRLHGMPLGRRGRAEASWEGDEELFPHLARFVTSACWDVEVRFGEPLEFTPDMKRRHANQILQDRVTGLLGQSLGTFAAGDSKQTGQQKQSG